MYAFCRCKGLTTVVIGNGLTSIGDAAFNNCSSLTSINIPESVKSIGNGAFGGCSGLTSITIPEGVTSIGDVTFSGCSSLTSFTIPESVKSIGSGVFEGCIGLTSITIPESVSSIENYTFGNCSNLVRVELNSNTIVAKEYSSSSSINKIFGSQVKEYILGDNVKSIGDYAFYGCNGLTAITIPSSITDIGEGAFSGCSSLSAITIPESVTSFGDDAFSDCNNMETIIYLSASPFILEKAIFPAQFMTGGTLYVPAGARQTYVERGWNMYFCNIVELGDDPTHVNSVAAESGTQVLFNNGSIMVQGADDDTLIQVFDLNGRLIGQTKAAATGTTKIAVPAGEKMLIVKVGDKSVKVLR